MNTITTHSGDPAAAFIQRWQGNTASELSTSQSFIIDLCELLGVPRPHPTPARDYMFERPITFRENDGSTRAGRVDCYRRGAFVWESKKLPSGVQAAAAKKVNSRFDTAMKLAHAQAQDYARALPAAEGRPPFLVVVDVGHVIELFAEFTRSGSNYTAFPDPQNYRIRLEQLADATVRDRLRLLWTDPLALDPARASARVTRAVAKELAELARSLEAAGHPPQAVAAFLARCLFSMFAEDIGLLPQDDEGLGGFVALLTRYRTRPERLTKMLHLLWQGMDTGGPNGALEGDATLRFNGKIFKGWNEDGYVLPLTPEQVDGLLRAARANWTEVEPAIFGTLLERALDPDERHALGAHYTPRSYVERLVLPTVVEPLRADWANAQAAALLLVQEAEALEGRKHEAKLDEARDELRRFHHQLCSTRVLDPACGSGNFLYVTLEHLKRLEGEVLNQLDALGDSQHRLGWEGETVTLQQLRGIEINPRAAAMAELVLWIGWLQWHVRTRGIGSVAEPVVHDYGNIECRDAVLAYDRQELATDADGKVITRWDGKTVKKHPVTGEDVPDEAAQVPEWCYLEPRRAEWPSAEFIVGNPPFIGNKRMRDALGNGYAAALRRAWPAVPETADFVMYWWQRASELAAQGQTRRFGLITTNSITQVFNRRVVESSAVDLAFAIPDHPWVDTADGAAVRVAMTVGTARSSTSAAGTLLLVTDERDGNEDTPALTFKATPGKIHANLSIGADVNAASRLRANLGLSFMGMIPLGAGFWIDEPTAKQLGRDSVPGLDAHVRRYRNGKDLTDRARGVLALDFYGLDEATLRARFPAAYQWLLDRVKPARDHDKRESRRRNWWLFAESVPKFRAAVHGLPRYIGTTETAKHRLFTFLDADILPDQKVRVVVSAEALILGVLSSSVHVEWTLRTGGTLEDRPVYNNSRCFEPFPFPSDDTGLTPALAEQLDAHRKARQAAHEAVTLTGMYNVLAKLRSGEALTPKDKLLHEQGLVSVLRTLHDELDEAVLKAYGWDDLGPAPWADEAARSAWTEALLERLVALNARRAAEEAAGSVRWLRPEFQDPARRAAAAAGTPASTAPAPQQQAIADLGAAAAGAASRQGEREEQADPDEVTGEAPPPVEAPAPLARQPWPTELPAQVKAVAEVLAANAGALDEAALAERFTGRGPWKKRLPSILETLEAVGRARRDGPGWRG